MTRPRKNWWGFSAALAASLWWVPASPAGEAGTAGAEAASEATETDFALPDLVTRPWTGDLDGMIQRRIIRVLVPYSKTFYFVDRGTQRGLVHDAYRLFEEDLNKKLETKHIRVHVFFVPTARDEIVPALLEGRGDLAAANLTITPERLARVDFADPSRRNVSEIVVTGPGAPAVATVDDLSGHEVYLRPSSSFFQSIQKLNEKLAAAGKAPVKVRPAPEELEVEDILEMVNAGLVKITIADDHIADFWKRIFPKINPLEKVAVRTGGEIAVMIRKDSPQLKAEINAFLARYPEGSAQRNQLFKKYLVNTKWAKEATSTEEIAKLEKTVEFFRRYGDRYELDYLLMMAQGYQESRLDQNARSPVGAIGVMQVMPATGKDMAVGDIGEMEANIHAGVKYMRFVMKQFYDREPMTPLDKGLFTFASYNAGPGRLQQLRKEASKRGLDPNVWFNSVEVIAAEKIGRETVQYVSNIYKYYLAYRMVMEEREARARAKESATAGATR